MKAQLNFRFLLIPALIFVFIGFTTMCTHEDEVLDDIVDTEYDYGTDVINAAAGYEFVKVHSSITWESAYLGVAATITGRFNDFALDIDFDADNPENTSLSGSVVLSSVNTGEPGRDGGCLMGTFQTSVGGTEEASFVSTSVEKDGVGGYNVTGDFTFLGVTAPITGKLTYLGQTFFDTDSGVHNAPLWVAGFLFEFDLPAQSVFGMVSGNVADRVAVRCNGQFKWYM